jgi:hypothetical protein
MPTREEMIVAIKNVVVPELRERNFTGPFPHFRRLRPEQIDLLSFQFDKWGGGFVVEISKCDPGGVTMSWGEHISPKKVTAQHLVPNDRIRLGCEGPSTDHWFRYDRGKSPEVVAREVTQHLDKAEKWWAV